MKKFIDFLTGLLDSGSKFVRASIISLIVIAIIFFLMTKLEQAFIMIVDMIERDGLSFAISTFLIIALAVSLSHYPIYTYHAGNVNKGADHFNWFEKRPFSKGPFRFIRMFTFKEKPVGLSSSASTYKIDPVANYLRYSIGVIILLVWWHIIWSSFEPKLRYEYHESDITEGMRWTQYLSHLIIVLIFGFYIILKRKVTQYRNGNHDKLIQLQARIAAGLTISVISSISLLLAIIIAQPFSAFGLLLLFLLICSMTFNYILFRLIRSDFGKITMLRPGILTTPIRAITRLHKEENYLLLMFLSAVVSLAIIVYSIYATITYSYALNGVPILLAYLYLYSYILATLGKYYFIAGTDMRKSENPESSPFKMRTKRGYYIITAAVILLVGLSITGMFTEKGTNQLTPVRSPKISDQINIDQFLELIEDKDTLFFISSHGGGLMANTWTLKVINALQKETQGGLFNNTFAVSGASGGSLGLALYIGLYKNYGNDYNSIDQRIQAITQDNYTSKDLSMMFGPDAWRNLWPLNRIVGKNRVHYSMVGYQRHVDASTTTEADQTPFRAYWKEAVDKNSFCPSLIMNTAGIDGRRGILWSVNPRWSNRSYVENTNEFDSIFHNAVDLAELNNGTQTLSYYQGTSLTNRFPLFSPSGKIKKYGHFIDAGAIDNSGLLGCLDVFNYIMKHKPEVFENKHIVFIEISHSKSVYVKQLLDEFQSKRKPGPHDPLIDEENESSTLSSDFSAGINLDKIPGYLRGFTEQLARYNSHIEYIDIPLPRKVTIDDIESLRKGELCYCNSDKVKELNSFLYNRNQEIEAVTENQRGLSGHWEYYEPVLSRHMSNSSLRYNDAILNHVYIRRQFDRVKALAGGR